MNDRQLRDALMEAYERGGGCGHDLGGEPLDELVKTVRGLVPTTDYLALLIRYIHHVRSCEGVDFILTGMHHDDDSFSAEEWETLRALASDVIGVCKKCRRAQRWLDTESINGRSEACRLCGHHQGEE